MGVHSKPFSGKAETWAIDVDTGEIWRSIKTKILEKYMILNHVQTYEDANEFGSSYKIIHKYYVKRRHIDAQQINLL